MASPLDLVSDTIARLGNLSDELEGTLLRIAYDGQAENRTWIRRMQCSLRREYGSLVETLATDLGPISPSSSMSPLLVGIACVVRAYDGFQDLLRCGGHSEAIEEDAKDLLYENLILPDDDDSLEMDV